MTPEQLAQAQKLLADGMNPAGVAAVLGIAHSTFLRRINAAGYQIEQQVTFHLVPVQRVELPAEASR